MTTPRLERIEDLTRLRDELRAGQRSGVVQIRLCMTGCRALGAEEVCAAFRREIAAQGLGEQAVVVDTGCQGFCALAPVVTIAPPGVFYGRVAPEDVKEIIARTVLRGEVIERLAAAAPGGQVPFFAPQLKVVLRNCGEIDPLDLGQYVARDGYQALVRVLQTMTPEQAIETVTKSGLRGRGGAGFPTGVKWKAAHDAAGAPKYLICNGDEGDPGAFMDRAVLEGDPHSVIEGMLIGAYAIGATKGYVYVRAEYPIAVRHMQHSVAQLRAIGLLGENILGTGLNFDLEIKEGAGAFVCGEETAMIASLEGKRGTPRPRPPFPVHSGLWGRPTTINNVETLANLPPIFLRGWEWFAALGTEKSKGTKVFALAGKVNHTGLVEVPMGATLREIVYDVGGGIPRGRKFKAAQTGGPSGGCVPARFMDLPLDYDSLKQVGAIMGSGGLIIMDEGTCMVDMARYFLDFTQKESCGKCTPCRIGTRRMLEILTRICNGQGREGDIEALEEIARTVSAHSLCALGKTAPNPVLSTIRYFREEYEEHIRDHHCRAAVCEALVKAPCTHLCPAGINIPEYITLVGLGKYQRAADLIRRRNPFASICGRICHHPCEVLCRRGDLDEPIAIMDLKRIATDLGRRSNGLIARLKANPTGKKVAIVGAGPGGLSAGYFLSLMGHQVTVFEAGEKAGGMIRSAIPEFRLPSSVLDAEIEFIQKSGLTLRTSTPVDAERFAQLRRDHDAIFISVGSHFGTGIVSPEEGAGILEGFDFLRRVKAGERLDLGRRVVVVTGCQCPRSAWCSTAGTTAVDSARTALRLGASEVSVLYRRDRDEMPSCAPGELEEAIAEGVKFVFLAGTKKINRNGRVQSVECVRFKLGELDDYGHRKATRIEGSEFTLPADTIIRAAGQERSIYNFLGDCGAKLNKWALLETGPRSLMTAAPGIFAGGDCITGHGTVVEAVGAGQSAAVEIDRYLGGKGELPANSDPLVANLRPTREEGLEGHPRAQPPRAEAGRRAREYAEVTGCFDRRAATGEAKRCLRCDLEEYAHQKV